MREMMDAINADCVAASRFVVADKYDTDNAEATVAVNIAMIIIVISTKIT